MHYDRMLIFCLSLLIFCLRMHISCLTTLKIYGINSMQEIPADIALTVEHIHGKDGVASSNLAVGTIIVER